MTDAQLMQAIKTNWGKEISIACASSSVPQAFLAALIANESGGKPDATRYEPAVSARLQAKYPQWTGNRLTNNATSWGLLQIMGENYPADPVLLADPQTNLVFGISMLASFAERWELDLTKDFEELFRCWNTGAPNRPTYDPNYVPLGLTRIALWNTLPSPTQPPSGATL